MSTIQKIALTSLVAITMLFGMGSARAALVNFEFEGTLLVGDETFPNIFNLTAGDIITATGTFDDSILGVGINTTTFDGIDTTLSIDVNGTIFTQADDPGASITLQDGLLYDFNFLTADFSSYFTQFNDPEFMLGTWSATPTITAIPVPAALWLFGSGLIGLAGVARRAK